MLFGEIRRTSFSAKVRIKFAETKTKNQKKKKKKKRKKELVMKTNLNQLDWQGELIILSF